MHPHHSTLPRNTMPVTYREATSFTTLVQIAAGGVSDSAGRSHDGSPASVSSRDYHTTSMTYQLHAFSSQHIASELPGSRTVEAGTMTATTSGTSSMVCAQPEYTVTHTFMSHYGTITAQYLLYTHTT